MVSNLSLPHGVPRRNGKSSRSFGILFIILMTAIPSAFLGASIATLLHWTGGGTSSSADNCALRHENLEERIRDQLEAAQEHLVDKRAAQKIRREIESLCREQVGLSLDSHAEDEAVRMASTELFPTMTVGRFAAAMSRVDRSEFLNLYDPGVPLDPSTDGASQVLLVYANAKVTPTAMTNHNEIPELSTTEALENCDQMHVALLDHGTRKQCLALVPQYESFHLQNWMRLSKRTGELDSSSDFALVSRGHKSNGRNEFDPPDLAESRKHWKMLQQYFDSVDDVLAELKPILTKIAKRNTVIVMVVNFGQSELLINFVCAAKSRQLDLSNVIVFTTDQEATDLANGMGLATYFDQRNFGNIPSDAAKRYGDARFVAMMMAKVICVQLVSMLGFDFLFQDVDIVWYQDPLAYFFNTSLPAHNYDVFFQDDGGHSVRYAPYSANSGFYFIRYNARTRHFLTSLLMAGDLILATDSHQQALIATLNEHVSLYGLKAKVLSRDLEEFPGGFQFHKKDHTYMKKIFDGTIKPIIFHMSWTNNKDNKLLFFRQMGEWYVQDKCIGKVRADIPTGHADLPSTCCAAAPLFSCHYKDKPSLKPCRDSPPIDKGKPSWW